MRIPFTRRETSSSSTVPKDTRPEEAVGSQEWFDRNYHREIRRKHVAIGALFFAAGSMFPSVIASAILGQYPFASFLASAMGGAFICALPMIAKLEEWSKTDRIHYREAQNAWAECSNDYRDLCINYTAMAEVLRQQGAEGGADSSPSAEVIYINGLNGFNRRDH